MRSGKISAIALMMLLALALTLLLAPMAGYHTDSVRSGSMSPAISAGDLVVTGPVNDKDIHVGDVITFRHDGLLICHRVINIDTAQGQIQTKGDANEHPDPFLVPYSDVVGKVNLVVPAIGDVVTFLKSPFGWALIIILGALVLFLGDNEKKNTKTEDNESKEGSL
jgi:signal peptidase